MKANHNFPPGESPTGLVLLPQRSKLEMARCRVGGITAFEEPLLNELASNFRL